MEFIGVFSDLNDIIQEAEERFMFVSVQKKMNSLHNLCDILAEMVKEFDCSIIDLTVHEHERSIEIEMIMPDLELHGGRTHPFFEAIHKTDVFGFKKSDDDNICAYFEILGLWE